jgi:transcriptional regulator with XRE-family HTH domain
LAGLSQEALAEAAGLSTHAIWLLEAGRSADPRPSTLKSLADALGVDIAALHDPTPEAVA